MSSRNSVTRLNVKRGHKIVKVDHLWYNGISTGSKRLNGPPSWDSERIMPGVGDVHVHRANLGNGQVAHQIWVYDKIKGKTGWRVAKEGFQHPEIPDHSVDFSQYQLLCEANPEHPKWVKAERIARVKRERQSEERRLAEFNRTLKPSPKVATPTLFVWDDNTCDAVTSKTQQGSSCRPRGSSSRPSSQRRDSMTLTEDSSDSEEAYEPVQIYLPRGMDLRAYLRSLLDQGL
ncbi:hypothetical protein FRC02_006082 [Tulasnella sp. 418]|nr:hypothetical protein FRC02_006082 [Tulasnella sp. 418]